MLRHLLLVCYRKDSEQKALAMAFRNIKGLLDRRYLLASDSNWWRHWSIG